MSDGRDVNLQVLDPQLARIPGLSARLTAVAAQVGSLQDPQVVATLEVVVDEGVVAVVTEAVRGVPVSALVDADGTLPAASAIAVAGGVLSAVSAAHGAGLVHCGIVPERVLVQEDGEVRLDGFALARALALTGGEAGAPARGYSSPERLGGTMPDGIGDLYGAAALTHALLIGAPPAPGAAAPVAALPGMSAVLSQAVAPEPAHRFPSASALRDAITSTASQTLGQGWRAASDLAMRARAALGALETAPIAPAEAPAPAPPPTVAPEVAPPRPRRRRLRTVLLLLFALLIVAAGAAGGIYALTRSSSSPTPLAIGNDIKLDVTRTATGDCNVSFHFVATGSISGQGQVVYQFIPSDGSASSPQTVSIADEVGFSFDYTYTYTGHRTGPATMTFQISSPVQRSVQKQYDTTCS